MRVVEARPSQTSWRFHHRSFDQTDPLALSRTVSTSVERAIETHLRHQERSQMQLWRDPDAASNDASAGLMPRQEILLSSCELP